MSRSIASTEDYKTDDIWIEFASDMNIEEAKSLIGKTISKVISTEYSVYLVFTDNSTMQATGSRWGDCSLGIELTTKEGN